MKNLVCCRSTLFAAVVVLAPSALWSQNLDQGVCSILASKLTPDLSSQTSAETRQRFYRNLIKSETFRSFGRATSSTLDAGLSVVGYVDATLGTTSNESNWETNWTKFANLTDSAFAMSASAANFSSRWNPDLIASLLQSCSTTSFYGQLVSVNTGNNGFTIKLNGVGKWQLTGVKTSPSDASLSCGGDEKASETSPIEKFNDRLLTCTKDPRATLSVTVSASQGDAGPFTVLSVEDDLRRQMKDEAMVLTSAINLLQRKVEGLEAQQSTQADAIKGANAAIQLSRSETSYMIIPNSIDCPAGWSNLGMVGFLLQTANVNRAALGSGGPYGAGEWTWTHPYLCKRQ